MYRPVFYFIIHKLKFAYKSRLYRNNTASKKFLSPYKLSFVAEYRNIVRGIRRMPLSHFVTPPQNLSF